MPQDHGHLPTVAGTKGQVLTAQGAGADPVWSAAFTSSPPSGMCRVTNLYVDPATGKLVVEYDDTPA